MLANQDVAMTDQSQSNPIDQSVECNKRYERIDKLGEGTYGIVYRSRDRETNEVLNSLVIFYFRLLL